MLKISRILSKFVFFLYFLSKYRKSSIAYFLSNRRFSIEGTKDIYRKGDSLVFTTNNNIVPIAALDAYKILYPEFVDLLSAPDCKVVSSDGSVLQLMVNGIAMKILSVSNLGIAHELFRNHLYDFSFGKDRYTVMDIGMNVGFASLLFAAYPKVEKVYSYEPFPNTYQEAVANIQLNPSLVGKILPQNFGISDKEGVLEVPQIESGDASGSTSDFVIQQHHTQGKTIQVGIKSIVGELQDIKAKHPQNSLFVKIDCEGEEYHIIPAILSSAIKNDIDGMVIEWHIKGPEVLVQALNDAHFNTFHMPHPTENCGLIYAFRIA